MACMDSQSGFETQVPDLPTNALSCGVFTLGVHLLLLAAVRPVQCVTRGQASLWPCCTQ
jgi:hypothetical protein